MKLNKDIKLTGKNSRLANMLVRFSFKLEKSYRYNAVKNLIYNLLENPNSRSRIVFDVIMIFMILLSIVLLIYGVKHVESKLFSEFSRLFELFIVIVFICEYLLRFWVYNHNHRIIIEQYEHSELTTEPITLWLITKLLLAKKWKYVSSPLAVIDLLAILPSYRPLRFLRLFLLFRLFKLFRYTRVFNSFGKVLLERRIEFFTLAIFLSFLVFASSTAIYFFEGNGINPHINSYFDAIYWALVTVSTVGFGDITPVSIEGRFVTLILIISGMGVLAFSTSIVVAAFSEKLGELKKNQVYAEIEQLKDYVIICGYGRVGETIASLLRTENTNVLVIDNDEMRTNKAKLDGFLAITGDAGDSQLLHSIENRKHSPVVLCLTGSDVTNVYITLTIKKLYKKVTVISRANRQDTTKKLELAGADQVIAPYKVIGLVAFESIGKQVAFEAIYGMLTEHKYFSIDTIPFQVASKVQQILLKDIDFKQFKVTLLGMITEKSDEILKKNNTFPLIKRKFIFNPDQSFIFSAGTMLVVFGHKYSVKNLRDKLVTAKIVDGHLVL